VLASVGGQPAQQVAREAEVSRPMVWRWQQRFAEAGPNGLLRDKTRKPGKPPIPTETVARVVALTCVKPPPETTHLTGRAMAKIAGISLRSVQRIWDAHQLQPHRVRSFKALARSALRRENGRYRRPLPRSAGSHGGAVDRREEPNPGAGSHSAGAAAEARPLRHDDTRLQAPRPTTLFAAPNVMEGTVIGRCMQRHRHPEFIRFLNTVEREVPTGKMIEAIVDNYATHKHPKVRQWLARHPRWTFHFTPTSASWLNAVEGYFAKLTKRRLQRGSFRSVVELQAAIRRFLAETNADPRPFRWTKDPAKIIAAVKRGHQVLDSIH
jgi:transposase